MHTEWQRFAGCSPDSKGRARSRTSFMTTLGPSTIRQIRIQHVRTCEPLQVRGAVVKSTCQPDKAFVYQGLGLRSFARRIGYCASVRTVTWLDCSDIAHGQLRSKYSIQGNESWYMLSLNLHTMVSCEEQFCHSVGQVAMYLVL